MDAPLQKFDQLMTDFIKVRVMASKKSWDGKFSWFFGGGIPNLDPIQAPVESDIVRLCIHVFDSCALKDPDENTLINQVKDILILYFQSQNENSVLMQEKAISTKIKRLLLRAKKYELRNHVHQRDINDQSWISSEKTKKFSKVFDITKDAAGPSPKQKSFLIDDNEQVLTYLFNEENLSL